MTSSSSSSAGSKRNPSQISTRSPSAGPSGPVREIAATFARIKKHVRSSVPSVSEIAQRFSDPFKILVSTMISLRTKDEVTLAASARLFSRASDAASLSQLPAEEIARLIFPCGFYHTKGAQIKHAAEVVARHGMPRTREELLHLPGVGPKTANLTLGLGFGTPCICVDTHVHRIANRLGWVKTTSPEATELALEGVVPRRLWIALNGALVAFGQRVCTPLSPHCSDCPVGLVCPRFGVTRSR